MIVFFNFNEANLNRIIELDILKNKYTDTNTELILVHNFNNQDVQNLNDLKNFVVMCLFLSFYLIYSCILFG